MAQEKQDDVREEWHVLGLSGGKDSAALAVYIVGGLNQKGIRKLTQESKTKIVGDRPQYLTEESTLDTTEEPQPYTSS